MSDRAQDTEDLARRRRRVELLRDRFIAVSMRSRTLRLSGSSRTGAFDLHRVTEGPAPSPWFKLTASLGHEEAEGVVLAQAHGAGPDAELSADLEALAAAARSERADTGADTLAVGWPFIQGIAHDGTWLRAPLFLYPVELCRTRTGRVSWLLTPTGPPTVNDALAQVMARFFGVVWSLEAFLAADTDGVLAPDRSTWDDLVAKLRTADLPFDAVDPGPLGIAPLTRWLAADRAEATRGRFTLCPEAALGRFPLAATSVILDYDALLEGPLSTEVLGPAAASLMTVDESTDPAAWRALARDDAPTDRFDTDWRAFPSDSSQDAVSRLVASESLPGLVVQGPPGTGKSQLIANLLCETIARGATALVVCQKRAALDVVAARLSAEGLGAPIGVVHDVRRDRNEFCQALADDLAPLLDANDTHQAEAHHRALQLQRAHASASTDLIARLEATQRAWERQVGPEGERPGLAELDEALADAPALVSPPVDPTLTREALNACLRVVERRWPEHAPYAAPNPLSERVCLADARLDDFVCRTEALRDALAALSRRDRRATMTAREAAALPALWEPVAPLVDAMEAADPEVMSAFALFWTWCEGEVSAGQWRQLSARLERARRELGPSPWSLIERPGRELEAWIAGLNRLMLLETRWWRFASFARRRLRRDAEAIAALIGTTPGFSPEEDSPERLIAHLEMALKWQSLIADMPDDSLFFDFGFRGDPAGIDRALANVRQQLELVRETHRARELLAGHAPVYAELPPIWSVSPEELPALPFFAALVADARSHRHLRAVEEATAALRGLIEDARLDAILRDAPDGGAGPHLAFTEALLSPAHRAELPAVAALDRETAGEPLALRQFLRRHSPSPLVSTFEAFRLAVLRAWRRDLLGGERPRAVRWPLVAEESHAALHRAFDARLAHAAPALGARHRDRLTALALDPARQRDLRQLVVQARKQRYRLTLRQLVEQFWDRGLRDVCPVWLCSPDSVASLFPLRPGLFDLVIFDEASQCPVESALGGLLRARHTVIAGDDQQMPPSHFFRAATDDLDEEEAEEEGLLASESLLEASRQAFENITLRWHYRSRHEELIAFSNAAFYGNRLRTAPRGAGAADRAPHEGLRVEKVDGLWQEQVNPVEAEAVVERLRELLTSPEPPSVGVVTFNLRQAELIARRLDVRAGQDEVLAEALARDAQRPVTEQLFIRNLENVQGDERDVMVMSVGYAPAEPGGRVFSRFGPLGLDGGHRRLNVAITRARRGFIVILSVDPEALEVDGARHLGPKLLKEFLRFAVASSRDDAEGAASALSRAGELVGGGGVAAEARNRRSLGTGGKVLGALRASLEAHGYRTRGPIGLGDLHLDLAVWRPEAPSRQIAIDLTQHLTIPDAPTREIYAPRFWTRSGWKVLRLTPGCFLDAPDEVLAAVAEGLG